MAANVVPTITALEAEARASLFLIDHLPDRFTAGDAALTGDGEAWRVSVLLAYPNIGPVGEVGEIVIDARTEEIVTHTPIDEMLSRAGTVYNEHRDAIEGTCVETGVSR